MDSEDAVHIHNGIVLNYKKKNKILPFATTWMTPSEISQRETNTAVCYKQSCEERKS